MINFGKDKWKGEPVNWVSDKVINGHFVLVGGSGTGKTYNIRKILKQLIKEDPELKIHIIDVHGDIDIGEEITSSISFSETSDYGLQPLEISSDIEFGGVRKKIATLVSTLNNTTRQLGSNQETVFRTLLTDLYRASGFYQEDYKTWSLDYDPRKNAKHKKVYPTLTDLKLFAKFKLEQMYMGASSTAVRELEVLNKNVKKFDALSKKLKQTENSKDEHDKLLDKFDKVKETVKETYVNYIDNITTGRELEDILKYDSMDTIKRVYERIEAMLATGIFKSTKPKFDETKPIKRYVIKSLNTEEQVMFAEILLEQLFVEAKTIGEREGLKTLIVIDEAHIFVKDDNDHIINIIFRESRKFALGLMLASQSFGHFSEDIIANAATKLILGIDEMYHAASANKLRIEAKRFSYIIPQKTAMVQIKEKGSMTNQYLDISF